MQAIITAVGPDNRGLADPIVHYVTSAGANIAEIQMYDHDEERLFAMIVRVDWPAERQSVAELRAVMDRVGRDKAVEKAPALGLFAVEHASGVEQLGGAPVSDDARQDRACAHIAARKAEAVE